SIADDGQGYSPDVIDRLGEPYVTTRRADAQLAGEHGGLGLGIFIAKTLLERSGARLRLLNRKPPEKGALVSIEWPRVEFEKRSPVPLTSVVARLICAGSTSWTSVVWTGT
ncbi:ATP-binding protein, partial [uncultured Arthrobacter sp.]|uniref:ATP-binding protein n=1 Tax=uncultured Arthrobacter sp. TaxID=114050 RepID=UPI00321728B5